MNKLNLGLNLGALSTSLLVSIFSSPLLAESQSELTAPSYPLECEVLYLGPLDLPTRSSVLDEAVGGVWSWVPETEISAAGWILAVEGFAEYDLTVQPFEANPNVVRISLVDKVKGVSSTVMAGWFQEAPGATRLIDFRWDRSTSASEDKLQVVCWKNEPR